jgi:hypothetical protein
VFKRFYRWCLRENHISAEQYAAARSARRGFIRAALGGAAAATHSRDPSGTAGVPTQYSAAA